jgi:mitochondrial distribution and morphology protein 10
MRDFMDYVHSAFYEATGWTRDNSYAALNSTPDGMFMPSTASRRSLQHTATDYCY